jgi:hypothetical protein
MLVPYTYRNLTWAHHIFNERVAYAHAAAQGAFQRLKARWRCLERRTGHRVPHLLNMISACCALHNMCERSGEELDTNLQSEDDVIPRDRRDKIAHDLLHGNRTGFKDLFGLWPPVTIPKFGR